MHVCTIVSLPDQWLWCLVWEQDCLCACVQDCILQNGQQLGSASLVPRPLPDFFSQPPTSVNKIWKCPGDKARAVLLTASLNKVNLRLWRRWVVIELRAVVNINFVLKRIRKMAMQIQSRPQHFVLYEEVSAIYMVILKFNSSMTFC